MTKQLTNYQWATLDKLKDGGVDFEALTIGEVRACQALIACGLVFVEINTQRAMLYRLKMGRNSANILLMQKHLLKQISICNITIPLLLER